MTFKERIDQDLKAAMLGGDKDKVSVLRGLKSAILNEEVAKNARDSGLPEDQVLSILQKEAKKRQESADLFTQGGNQEKASAELSEKTIIEQYLPAALGEDEIHKLIDEAETAIGPVAKETMGKIIAHVKEKSGGAADGGTVAQLVKNRLFKGDNQ